MWASSSGLASKHLLLRICRRIPRCITTLLARFAPQLQEMNPRFADLIKRKTRIPPNTGFILPAVADGSRFHALCLKIAFSRRFRQEFGRSQGRTGGNGARKRQVLCRFGPAGALHHSSSPPHLPRVEPEGNSIILEATVACTNSPTPRCREIAKNLTLSLLSPPPSPHATIPPITPPERGHDEWMGWVNAVGWRSLRPRRGTTARLITRQAHPAL